MLSKSTCPNPNLQSTMQAKRIDGSCNYSAQPHCGLVRMACRYNGGFKLWLWLYIAKNFSCLGCISCIRCNFHKPLNLNWSFGQDLHSKAKNFPAVHVCNIAGFRVQLELVDAGQGCTPKLESQTQTQKNRCPLKEGLYGVPC